MLINRIFLHKSKKMTEEKKKDGQMEEKGTQKSQLHLPEHKISVREIAMGYMLW